IYDPAAATIATSASSLATPRSHHTALLLPNNNSVLIAGGSSANQDLNSTELYQSWNNAFIPNAPMSVARANAVSSAVATDGVALLAGGSNQSSTELYGFATVKTDQADYQPGTTVNISGTGWLPGETVTLTLVESPNLDAHGPYSVTVDASGNFTNSSFVTDIHDLGIRFFVTAVGSQSQAQNTFTDAKGTNTAISSSQNPSTAGNSVTFTATVTESGTGGGTSGTAVTVG